MRRIKPVGAEQNLQSLSVMPHGIEGSPQVVKKGADIGLQARSASIAEQGIGSILKPNKQVSKIIPSVCGVWIKLECFAIALDSADRVS